MTREAEVVNGVDVEYDAVITAIVDYVYEYEVTQSSAWTRAKTCLLDSIGAAFESVSRSPECARLLGPYFPCSSVTPCGFKVPGTKSQLDVVKGAFDFGAMIRYLDHNDAFPGAEWGHPSDNIGAILATADVLSRVCRSKSDEPNGIQASFDIAEPIKMRHVLTALVKAYEIQGCFQVKNAFNRVGLDHVILVKVACAAVVSHLMSLSKKQAKVAVSHAWMDGHPLRTYRQAPNAGPRKGWAAGEACKQAVHLALLASAGQPGAPSVLSTPRWGFYDTLFRGHKFELPRPYGSWVVENVIYKVNTAEGHGMTAVEAALLLANELRDRGLNIPTQDIARIDIRTQAAAMTIIDKNGPLHNPADRDHCMRYMVAVVLLKGQQISTDDYQDSSFWATDPRVDNLRKKIFMKEDPQMTADYHDSAVRSVANGLSAMLSDGTRLKEILVEYPQGHVKRHDTLELVENKARENLNLRISRDDAQNIVDLVTKDTSFDEMDVDKFVDMLWLGDQCVSVMNNGEAK